MEDIKIKQINKEKSNKNAGNNLALLVVELSKEPSAEWITGFNQNGKKMAQFQQAICQKNIISLKYSTNANPDEIFKILTSLIDQVNKEQDEFNSWIDKKNKELAGK